MRSPFRLVLAAVVVAGSLLMVLIGTWQAATPFVSPADLTPSLEGRRVQVEGRVASVNSMGGSLSFMITDGGSSKVSVTYRGERPLTLDEGRLVIAKGIYHDGLVEARQVSVRAHEEE